MKISLIVGGLFALGLAVPGLSQSHDHSHHEENASKTKTHSKPEAKSTCTPEHAAMGHCKLDNEKADKAVEPAKPKASAIDPSCSPEHAAMGHCTPRKPVPPTGKEKSGADKQPDKAAKSQTPPQDTNDPDCPPEHEAMGHCTPKKSAGDSKGKTAKTVTDQAAGTAPAPEAPEANYADQVWGKEAMAPVRAQMYKEHGGMLSSKFALDLAAARDEDGEDGYQWDGEAWFGGDLNRIVIKSEGESYMDEPVESAEVQAVYSRAIGPYFNLQAGLRHDFRPELSKTYAAFGFEGLAPYWNEVEGTIFVSDEGGFLGRFEGQYAQLITQRFYLETAAEINLSAQEIEDDGTGSGLVDGELSLKMGYEIVREVAPYLGISWERKFGETARFARARGESKDHSAWLAGLRLWM